MSLDFLAALERVPSVWNNDDARESYSVPVVVDGLRFRFVKGFAPRARRVATTLTLGKDPLNGRVRRADYHLMPDGWRRFTNEPGSLPEYPDFPTLCDEFLESWIQGTLPC